MATASLPPGFGRALMGLPADHMGHSKPPHLHHHLLQARVRLFAAEDAPDSSGTARQDLLQAKQTKFMHATVPISSSALPPGFTPTATMSTKPAVGDVLPQVPWRVPTLFNLHPSWRVVAGGESKEVALQRQREVRVLEAVYPRTSSIPESPAEPLEPQLPCNDEMTLVIPVVPVDDDTLDQDDGLTSTVDKLHFPQESAAKEGALSPPPGFGFVAKEPNPVLANWLAGAYQDNDRTRGHADSKGSHLGITAPAGSIMSGIENISSFSPDQSRSDPSSKPSLPAVPPSCQTETEPDVIAAAAAAYAALSQSNDHTKIDCGLLLKFLRNPSMMKNVSSQLSSKDSVENQVHEVSNLGTEGTRIGNGNQRDPAGISFPVLSIEQELLHVGGDIGRTERKTSVVAGGAPMDVVFERSQGFGPAQATNGHDNFPDTFNARVYNGPMHTSQPHVAQNGQLYIPATRPTSAQLHPPLSVPPPALQPVMPISGRPLSQHDEKYLKALILQHGRNSSEDDVHRGMNGRVQEYNVLSTNGHYRTTSFSGRSERLESAPMWPGKEYIDIANLSLRLGDGHRNVESISRSRMTQPRGKSRKACIYFNTAKGCRNGSSCVFIHDSNNAERAKLQKVEGGKAESGYK
ncbi:hypothetical protein CY35_11G040100 [Sphagnum magellanicum]|nr:hypothetical protein CY35_11G040100 [Sphagnum magellanicum]